MRLQKNVSRKIGKTEYAKWVINIPPRIIEALGWKEGDELESEIDNPNLIVKKKLKEHNYEHRTKS